MGIGGGRGREIEGFKGGPIDSPRSIDVKPRLKEPPGSPYLADRFVSEDFDSGLVQHRVDCAQKKFAQRHLCAGNKSLGYVLQIGGGATGSAPENKAFEPH